MKQANSFDNLPITLSVEQIGNILGISRASAYNLVKTKDFPAVRIGERRIVIPKQHFLEWLNRKAGAS